MLKIIAAEASEFQEAWLSHQTINLKIALTGLQRTKHKQPCILSGT